MRKRLLAGALICAGCVAWHDPHVTITRAALDALPGPVRGLLAREAGNIAQVYSFYPDRYRNASPSERNFMRRFCELPGGRPIHNVTWDKAQDVESVEYLLRGILSSLQAGDAASMAQYSGTLAHLIEDSLSPAHAMDLRLLQDIVPPPEHARRLYVHAPMELSCPDFRVDERPLRRMGTNLPDAARAVIEACYAGIRKNRGSLIQLLQAVYRNDVAVMDELRLAAARIAAQQYGDAMYTVLLIARERGIPDPPEPSRRETWTQPNSGLAIDVASNSSASAAMNLAFGVREAIRLLAIDKRVLRTELGRVVIRVPGSPNSGCIELNGEWPPYGGSQVTEICLETGGTIRRIVTKLDSLPETGRETYSLGQWIRTVDHRGDPLFEISADTPALHIRNHKGATASLSPSTGSFTEGVLVNFDGAEPLLVRARQAEKRVEVDVSGRAREIITIRGGSN